MPGGGAWNRNGVILFAPSLADGLYRVAENGGKPQLVLKLDSSKFERSYLWPQFLPDDKHFVFFVQTDLANTTGVYAGTLDPPEYHRLFSSETNAVYSGGAAGDSSKSGYLLFIRDRHLMEQPFNVSKLAWEETPSRWRTISAPCGAWRWRPSRSRATASWFTRAWASPPGSWSGWTAAGSRSAKWRNRAIMDRRGSRRMAAARR